MSQDHIHEDNDNNSSKDDNSRKDNAIKILTRKIILDPNSSSKDERAEDSPISNIITLDLDPSSIPASTYPRIQERPLHKE